MSAASRTPAQELGGGLAVTGNYPGKARTPDELRGGLREGPLAHPRPPPLQPARLLRRDERQEGGPRRAERRRSSRTGSPGPRPSRSAWTSTRPTSPIPRSRAASRSRSADKAIRKFWIEHGIRCREIGAAIGKALGKTCVTNLWIPDGMKDTPADRRGPRERLAESLDAVFKKKIDPKLQPGLGRAEAVRHRRGELHARLARVLPRLRRQPARSCSPSTPAITIRPKASRTRFPRCCCYLPEIALHVSRGVRWDSDHVVTLTDELQAIAQEIVWGGYLDRVHIGLDYFDASINRVAAWVIGTRNMLKALLLALLAPIDKLRQARSRGRLHLAPGADGGRESAARRRGVGLLLRTTRTCRSGDAWLAEVKHYEQDGARASGS